MQEKPSPSTAPNPEPTTARKPISARKRSRSTWPISNDQGDSGISIRKIQEKIERLKYSKIRYELLEEPLKASGDPQISTTDPDSRALLVPGPVVEISYNIQAAVDGKHHLVEATHPINRNDRNALSAIAIEAKENLELDTYTALVDKGYHNGRELTRCKDENITTIVAHQQQGKSNKNGTQPTEETATCILVSEEA